MPTTSVKLPEALKRRAASVAKKQGISLHAFLVNAIEEVTAAEEAKERLIEVAKQTLAETHKSGKGYAADEVHAYIRERIAGRDAVPPRIKPWRD